MSDQAPLQVASEGSSFLFPHSCDTDQLPCADKQVFKLREKKPFFWVLFYLTFGKPIKPDQFPDHFLMYHCL
jgi:hypothetical protein